MSDSTQKMTVCLCFNDQAEEAAHFYVSVFKDARILATTRCGPGEPSPEGSVRTVVFELFGREYLAVNGGPYFKFTEGVSLMVSCETQEELDDYWRQLTDGGKAVKCGWLRDRFDLAWQVVPVDLGAMMADPDPEKSRRVAQALLNMVKLDIAALRRAYDGA